MDEAKKLEDEALKRLVLKKKNLLQSPDLKLKQRGYRFFLSRGYGINQVNDQLAQLERFHGQ